jgi:hypothetical protein
MHFVFLSTLLLHLVLLTEIGAQRSNDPNSIRPSSNRRRKNRLFDESPLQTSSSTDYSPPQQHRRYVQSDQPISQPERDYYEDEGDYGADESGLPKVTDLTDTYSKSVMSQVTVALSAGVCLSILSTIFMKMVLNFSHPTIVATLSIAFAAMTFRKGEVAELSKALGVFLILLVRQSTISSTCFAVAEQFKAALLLSNRKPFPPAENPWSYIYDPDQPGSLEFKMMNCLLCIVFGGAFLGWSIARSIPLFPGWLGALLLASSCGYLGTVRDPRGDLLRSVRMCRLC